jgi:hypothetical protein
MLGKPSDSEHQRRGLGFRAFTITGGRVTGSVAITAAGGARPRNCRRSWRTSSSATGSHPTNLMSPRIVAKNPLFLRRPAPPQRGPARHPMQRLAQRIANPDPSLPLS